MCVCVCVCVSACVYFDRGTLFGRVLDTFDLNALWICDFVCLDL